MEIFYNVNCRFYLMVARLPLVYIPPCIPYDVIVKIHLMY